jgi:hypothetical protein
MELMALHNEAAFEDALNGAVEEAVSEVDAVVDEADEFVEEESLEESPESEEISEEPSDDDEEVEFDSDEAEEVAEAPSVVEWNGNPDELPSSIEHDGKIYDLTKTYKAMQAGFTKKMQEIAEQRKQYEALTQQYQQMVAQQRQAAMEKEDPRPANPTTDMTDEQQERRWAEIQRWEAKQAYRDMVKEGVIPDPDAVKAQLADQERQYAAQRRYNMLSSQPGFNEQIENEMVQLAQENTFWANQLETDEGALVLYQFVQTKQAAEQLKKEAAALEEAKIKRSATAAKRATPKQTSQTKKAEPKPADRFAEMGFEDKISSIVDEAFDLQRG